VAKNPAVRKGAIDLQKTERLSDKNRKAFFSGSATIHRSQTSQFFSVQVGWLYTRVLRPMRLRLTGFINALRNWPNNFDTGRYKLGRYEIRSKIGEGGMGEAFLGQDTRLDRKVSLKILPADLAANEDRMRCLLQVQTRAVLKYSARGHALHPSSDAGTQGRNGEFGVRKKSPQSSPQTTSGDRYRSPQVVDLIGRDGEIRTRDLTHPNQAR
jgi:serine/threonine protein kinase